MIWVIQCWKIPRRLHIDDNSLSYQIIRWLMYNFYEALCNVYDGILPHKLKKNTRFGDYILCLTCYGIHIRIPTNLFTTASRFWSTGKSINSMRGESISTGISGSPYPYSYWIAFATNEFDCGVSGWDSEYYHWLQRDGSGSPTDHSDLWVGCTPPHQGPAKVIPICTSELVWIWLCQYKILHFYLWDLGPPHCLGPRNMLLPWYHWLHISDRGPKTQALKVIFVSLNFNVISGNHYLGIWMGGLEG